MWSVDEVDRFIAALQELGRQLGFQVEYVEGKREVY